ncbi:MAG: aldo/keto reductase [Paludibacter sp.]
MNKLLFSNADQLPAMGFGTFLSKKNEVYDAVLEAIRVGYRHIDCAYIYGNEAEIGQALQFAFNNGLVKREELFITSKLWNSDHAPERVEVAIRKSLKDLQLDYLNLYLIHWPIAFKTGHEQAKDANDLLSPEEMPVATTWAAMENVQKSGLTKHIGVSNFNIPKLQHLFENATIPPEVNQIELHPYLQQKVLVAFCQKNGVLLTAYSPLGGRHLIRTEGSLIHEPVILKIAAKHGCLPSQVVLAWGMQRGTAVIPKSVHRERIHENFGATNVRFELSDGSEIAALEKNLRLATGAYCVLPGGSYTLKSIWEE